MLKYCLGELNSLGSFRPEILFLAKMQEGRLPHAPWDIIGEKQFYFLPKLLYGSSGQSCPLPDSWDALASEFLNVELDTEAAPCCVLQVTNA